MKMLFWIYIIGCMCGLLAFVMISLKSYGYCKRKGIKPPKRHALEDFYGLSKIILLSTIPIYNYFLFLCVLFSDNKKLEQIIQNTIDESK